MFGWGLLSSAAVLFLEFQFRRGLLWLPNVWWIVPLNILIGFSVYQMFRHGTDWLHTVVLFGAVNTAARILLAFFVLHEPTTPGAYLTAGILVVGVLARLFVH